MYDMAARKKKTNSSDDSDTPEEELIEEILPEGGLVDEVVVDDTFDEAPEEQSVEYDEKLVDSILSSYLGDEMLEQLKEHAVIKDFETIDDANNALVFGGSTRNEIKFLQFRDEEDFLTDTGSKQSISSIQQGSLSPATEFRDEKIKQTLKQKMERLLSGPKTDKTRAQQAVRLANIRRINKSLTSVFGFDDPRQAEAFIAAWLMKDSTCRLSGIPGTGKTTAVESAGLLMANSYGFDAESRFIPRDPEDPDSDFFQFLKGQEYDAYLNNNAGGIRVAWDTWRFSEWYSYYEDPLPPYQMIKIDKKLNPENKPKTTEVSGSYLFDNTFLQKTYKLPEPTTEAVRAKKLGAMKPGLFRKALLNVWIWKQEKTSLLDESKYFEYHILPINLGLEAFANGDGRITGGQPHPNLEEMKKSVPEGTNKNDIPDYKALNTINYGKILSPGITIPDGSTLAEEVTKLNLRTDAGRNEGYDLREWLMTHYYDSRVKKTKDNPAGWTEIKGEMLREIGTAKIDYDKRADEVLYGMDIRQVQKQDPIEPNKTISTYEFEPIPRPVVTQPIKFFNEANRSQSGVEDAILGLIAEKEVEYRGRSFRSPPFVAWMDTNPHQKGNDLAFVDRIDMELMFSTLTLGQKFLQLDAQYNPQSISTEEMVKEAISQPQDKIIFDSHIGIASDSPDKAQSLRVADLMRFWDEISKLPFRSRSEDFDPYNYDGLRDISLLSVMFTQRFMSKPTVNILGGQSRPLNLPDARTIHSSPLIDISKASNAALLGDQAPNIAGFERNATAFGNPLTDDLRTQTPTIFNRVLGFRFQKSLVKLSRAFAFLRGKDFVTRTEILDALPFVVGHRMGPARAGSDAAKGRDVGYVANAMGALTNEQEMIKELIVAGYVEASTDEGGNAGIWSPLSSEDANPNPMNRKNTLLDVWDAYYQRCISILRSVENFTEYELKVLHPLKAAINGATPTADTTTPIHWHIAAMVVEWEKKAKEGDCLRKDDGMTYSERYNNYFKAMNAPTRNMNPLVDNAPSTGEAIQFDYSLYDYYYLRGKISNDPLLFTDDRTYLLELVESRIEAFVGPSFNVPPEDTTNVTYALSSASVWQPDDAEGLVARDWSDDGYIVEPNPGVTINSTYNDAIGGYGQLFGGNWTDSFSINSLMPQGSADSSIYEEMFVMEESFEFSYQMTSQKMRISGFYKHETDDKNDFIPIDSRTARSPGTYLAMSDAVTDDFMTWTEGMSGVVIDPRTKDIAADKLDFGVTMEDIELALESILLNPTMKVDKAIQKVIPSHWIQDVFTPSGAIFCFELRHHSSSRGANSLLLLMKDKGIIDQDATQIPGDQLRLWVWIAADITDDTEESSKTVSMVTTYGITSEFLENTVLIGNKIDLPGNFVSIDNKEFYLSGDKSEAIYLDSGNITEADISAYNMLFREAVRRSTQGA